MTQRLFFAVMLPQELRQQAGAASRAVPDAHQVRWVRPEGMHLTLRFLGDSDAARAAGAHQAGAEAVAGLAPFTVALGGLGVFPDAARARVIWAGITTGAAGLATLHARLERSLLSHGVVAESERFTAHLTLGRLRQDASPAARAAVGRAVASAPVEDYGSFLAKHLELIESVLGPNGARYSTVGSFALAAEE